MVGSAILHAGLALALFLATSARSDEAPRQPTADVLLLPDSPPPAIADPVAVVLGLDDEKARGDAWLGVLDASPHSAANAGQVDQAALSPLPAASTAPEVEAGATAPAPALPAEPAQSQPSSALEQPSEPSTSLPPPRALHAVAPSEATSELVMLEVSMAEDAPTSGLTAVEAPAPAQPVALPSEPAPTVADQEPAHTTAGADERPGLLDPRESDAVARTAIPDAIPGRPLAASGLQITTVRPRWPVSTRVTRDPVNPTVRMTFSRAGRVTQVEFVKSTGFEDVDEPLRTALYKWTATGAPLAALPPAPEPPAPEPGITITLRVVLQ